LLVETAGPPESIFGAAKGRIAELDSGLAILEMGTLERHRESVLFDESRDAWIGAGVGVLGLALGMVGLYGVVSLVTVRRTKEIGLRMALGAGRADVLRLVLGRGFQMAVAGALLGVAVGLAGTRLLASRLHGIAPTDAASFAGGALCLLAAALLATTLPALRAARIDPMAAIREE
jgi:ABC-type antimicrobial peptide transport system permease subunit